MRLLLTLIFLTFISCKVDFSNPDVKNVFDEVMLVHDEVMPEINTIHQLKKSIKAMELQDSLSIELVQKLEDADESMMSWMAEFSQYSKMKNEKDQIKIEYLINEKNNISDISDMMKLAISEAENYIENQN